MSTTITVVLPLARDDEIKDPTILEQILMRRTWRILAVIPGLLLIIGVTQLLLVNPSPSALAMHRQHFTADPRASGWAHGFIELRLNGQRIIGHSGDTVFFHSQLILLPEHGEGLFVSYNGLGSNMSGSIAPLQLVQAFLDRYHPAVETPRPAPPSGFETRADRLAGTYSLTRRDQTTLFKRGALFTSASVGAAGDGALVVTGLAIRPDPTHGLPFLIGAPFLTKPAIRL